MLLPSVTVLSLIHFADILAGTPVISNTVSYGMHEYALLDNTDPNSLNYGNYCLF